MKYIFTFNESEQWKTYNDDKYKWESKFEVLEFLYDDKIIKKGHPEYKYCIDDCVKSAYNDDIIQIKSVKRLSDGEIFSLGSEIGTVIGGITEFGKITKIWPSFDQMRADINKLGVNLNNKDIKVLK